MTAKLLCKLTHLRQISLRQTLNRLIYGAFFILSPEQSVTQQLKIIVKYTNSKKNRGPKKKKNLSFLQAGPYCERSPHSLFHPSPSLGVTREQFVKLFFHVIASKSYNLPQHWSSTLMGQHVYVLRFAVGPVESSNACSCSTLGTGSGDSGW